MSWQQAEKGVNAVHSDPLKSALYSFITAVNNYCLDFSSIASCIENIIMILPVKVLFIVVWLIEVKICMKQGH